MVATQAGVGLKSFEYHPKSATYQAEYNQETTSASMAVVASLSEVMDVDPIELDSLYASVDTDALDELVRVRETTNGDLSVTLTVEEHEITVYSYGIVAIAPPEHDRPDDPNERVPLK